MSVKDEALKLAMETFQEYGRLHRAKNTEEGFEKAQRNTDLAKSMEDALEADDEGYLFDRKFTIRNGRLVNRVSGAAIPDHEPVFIFRARDRHLPAVLAFYQTIVADGHHRLAIQESIDAVRGFATAFPHELKEPGITHDFKLTTGYLQAITPTGGVGVHADVGYLVVDQPGTGGWRDVWDRFGKPRIIAINQPGGGSMRLEASWSDGEMTSIDFRNFQQHPGRFSHEELERLFHERRFMPAPSSPASGG